MKFTEKQLRNFASPLSETEAERCKNAIRMVRDAMKSVGYTDYGAEIRQYEMDTWAYALDLHRGPTTNLTLLIQGSYANNTNVKAQSDVDLAVILESTFEPKFRPGITAIDYKFSDATFSVQELKNEIEVALREKFNTGVERNDKSIKVYGNSYRVDSDIIPAYRYRDYSNDYSFDENNYVGGIEIQPDSGGKIINFPEQQIRNGRKKNVDTGFTYKKCVRIIKNIKELMAENKYSSTSNVCSFQLESLLWNVPIETYNKYSSTLKFVFDEVLSHLFNKLSIFGEFLEANARKKLFLNTSAISEYQKFIIDLKSFYNYDIKEG